MATSPCRLLGLLWLALPALAQIPGQNVNMVSGTQWPSGDPFLQRQNEPSLAVSSRNPSHLLAGSNDYRTVDLPGLPNGETGDAWLGIFKSYDGGRTWRSTVHPGCPQRVAACDGAAALRNYAAGADPVVRAGTSGMFYYSAIAFTRETPKKSLVFVSRFLDRNDQDHGDPIQYVSTVPVATGGGSVFVDKPWLAVDIPRASALTCEIAVPQANGNPLTQRFPGGNLYLAWTQFTDESKPPSQIMFSRSLDCGATWSKPLIQADGVLNQGAAIAVDPATGRVYLTWRRFKSPGVTDAILFTESSDAGQTFSPPQVIAEIAPFDQGTTNFSLRTNAYPTMAVDGSGRVYIAWSERNRGRTGSGGDARIVLTTSQDRRNWTARKPVSDYPGRGHQFMPAMAFGGGKVMVVFYDARLDTTVGNFASQAGGRYIETRVPKGDLATTPPHPQKVFTDFLLDAAPAGLNLGGLLRRHTIDVFAAQADPGDAPVFSLSRVSQYSFGSRRGEMLIEQMQVNPPNLPLFRQGAVPFLGDYLDVAPSPSFLPGDQPGAWKFNTEPSNSAAFHTAWTDNRDVRPPANGDWADYTPPISGSAGAISIFDPSQPVPACRTGQAGMRNQNIYTSRITQGLLLASPSNAKTLGAFQRDFPVDIVNSTDRARVYRLSILNQPSGGKASFLQVPAVDLPDPLTELDLNVAAGSSAARMIFITSTDPHARVRVRADEITAPGGSLVAGGLSGDLVLNPDPSNPDIANPDIANPDIANPDIANPDIANPDIANPDIANPDIANPDIANPDIANPDIANPDIANPDIANPDIANPDIANPDIANVAISDVTWRLGNHGSSTSTYSVEFLLRRAIPPNVRAQLVIHRVYANPVSNGCILTEQPHHIVVANIIDPKLLTQQTAGKLRQLIAARARAARGESLLADPNGSAEIIDNSLQNPTVNVAPGETVYATLRFYNLDKSLPLGFDPAQDITAISVQHAINPGGTQPPVAASHLLIATTDLPAATRNSVYDEFLAAAGGTPPYTWTLVSGALPPGLSLSPAGEIAGTIAPGAATVLYSFTVRLNDSSRPALPSLQQNLTIRVSSVTLAITSLAARGPNGGSVHPGEPIVVTATLLNSGSQADAVIPGISLNRTGSASADCGPPVPPSTKLATGSRITFTFTCVNTTGSGTLRFSVAIVAIDHLTSAGIEVSPATSNPVSVLGVAPRLTAAYQAAGAPYTPGSWSRNPVTVTFTCLPSAGAAVAALTQPITVSTEASGQFVSGACTDVAGNQASIGAGPISVDRTPPVVTGAPTVAAPASGWYRGPVSVVFRCTDALSGVAPGYPTGSTTLGSDTAGTVVSGHCRDQAGNVSVLNVGPIRIDSTPPGISVLSPLEGATYPLNGAVLAAYTCSDRNGIASCQGTAAAGSRLPTGVAGDFTFTVTATDPAGNRTTATRTYHVR